MEIILFGLIVILILGCLYIVIIFMSAMFDFMFIPNETYQLFYRYKHPNKCTRFGLLTKTCTFDQMMTIDLPSLPFGVLLEIIFYGINFIMNLKHLFYKFKYEICICQDELDIETVYRLMYHLENYGYEYKLSKKHNYTVMNKPIKQYVYMNKEDAISLKLATNLDLFKL